MEENELKDKVDTSKKKKPNIILYTLVMLVVFVIITEVIIWGYAGGIISKVIINYPQGELVIGEAVLASLVLIVMLLFKNSYVFTQDRVKWHKSFKYGAFYLIGSVLFMLLYHQGFTGGLSLINLVLGCFLVGVAEEFLCRGWLLNEFLERYGDTKKGVWYSIVISGVIFGLMHLGNIYAMGQSFAMTIIQVMSAAASGILFGLIYYKTKNIWTVITLHGLWDFSLFLSDISPITSSVELTPNLTILGIILAILMIMAELINIIPYIKDIDSEPKTKKIIGLACLSMFLYLVFVLGQGLTSMNFGETYEYDSISISEYAVTKDNYETYYMNVLAGPELDFTSSQSNEGEGVVETAPNYDVFDPYENYSFEFTKNSDDNLVLTNKKTNYSVTFECEDLEDYIILDDGNRFVLVFLDYTDSSNHFMNYIYLYKRDLRNTNEYLDSIKTNIKKYLIKSTSELVILSDRNTPYVAAYNVDDGYFVLVDDKVSILNRD